MTTKATHEGECQLCGRRQKLPSDRLSLHGYTKRWGFFQGTCPGSRELPYEHSCELLPARMERAHEQAASLRANAAKHRADREHVWVYEHIRKDQYGRRLRHSEWQWRQLPVNEVEIGARAIAWKKLDGQTHKEWVSADDIISHLNERMAKQLESHAQKIEKYAAWLKQRIAAWKRRDLTPVSSEPKPVPEGYCAGQGQPAVNPQLQYYSPRGTCPTCKRTVSVTKLARVRRHKIVS